MANKIQPRRDTAANWTAANPVLSNGELGIEIDTKRSKWGDGTTTWNTLAYRFDKTAADALYATQAQVSVASENYNIASTSALGNGVRDDSADIQSLIDSAAAEYAAGLAFTNKKVVVQLCRGQFGIGVQLQYKTGVILRGIGKSSALVALSGLGASALIVGTSGNTVSDAVIENLAMVGSYSTSPLARTAIQITNGARIEVRRVKFSDFGGAGVLFQGLNAGGGTPDSQVIDCNFDGIGLSDGTTGFGILFKDNSQRCIAKGNVLKNIKGGMGIGGNGSSGTGYPLRCTIVNNVITMSASTTGFEGIGWTAGCDYWLCGSNHVYDSFDNGISCSGAWANVHGNTIDGAWNHGIASAGDNNIITGNLIRNVGKENPASAFAFISATATVGNYITLNKGVDDQVSKTTTHGVKFSTSGGSNIVFGNTWTGHTGATVTGNISTDLLVTFSADGIQTRRVSTDIIQENTSGNGIAVSSTFGMNGLAFTGSGRLGSGQHVFSSNLAASRPATYCYAQYNQAADMAQWATTASDNITQTVRSRFDKDGVLITKAATPADAQLTTGDVSISFSSTSGSSAVVLKGKEADGTIISRSLSLRGVDGGGGSDLTQTSSYNPTANGKAGAGTEPILKILAPSGTAATGPGMEINVKDSTNQRMGLLINVPNSGSGGSPHSFEIQKSSNPAFGITRGGNIDRFGEMDMTIGGKASVPADSDFVQSGVVIEYGGLLWVKRGLGSANFNIHPLGYTNRQVTKTANYTLTYAETLVIFNGSSLTATLPDPTTSGMGHREFAIKNIHSTDLTVVSAGSAKTIDGAASVTLAQWAKIRVTSDGTQWLII